MYDVIKRMVRLMNMNARRPFLRQMQRMLPGLLLLLNLAAVMAEPPPRSLLTIPEMPQQLLSFLQQSPGFSAEMEWKRVESPDHKRQEKTMSGSVAITKDVIRVDWFDPHKSGWFGRKRGDDDSPFQLYDSRSNMVYTVLLAIDGYSSALLKTIPAPESRLVEAGKEKINGTSAVKWMLPMETNAMGLVTNFVWLSVTGTKQVVRWESSSLAHQISIDFKKSKTEAKADDLQLALPNELKEYPSTEYLLQEMLRRTGSQRSRLHHGEFSSEGSFGDRRPR